ncbi:MULTISPECIES: carboxypeptidase regulatory-like domain-containing protein [unclassified Aeromicrobium]|uniref:carboxypeptidase regulatory-like domain-containing protein n=1 Tax=unclassified Aeromicrobium TaxID=2633570 RepID=UPI00288AA927|nr:MULTISPECIES: carboxypeptidase regulatory-like domain-containing protein [unclassified Aeromicrobium]
MDTHRSLLRVTLTSVVVCVAMAAAVLPAQGADVPSPEGAVSAESTAPSAEPSDATQEGARGEQAPDVQAPVEESTAAADEDAPAPAAALAPTAVSLARGAGTQAPQEPMTGTVTATTDGAPLAGATVRVSASGPTPRSTEVTTGADGTADYAVAGLSAGTYSVTAEVLESSTHAASTSSAAALTVQAGKWVSLLVNSGYGARVLTGESFWLRGRVLTTSGRPDAGATVVLYRTSGSKRTKVATARTNSSGWYTWSPPDRRGGTYQAQVSTSRYSAKQAVTPGGGERSLASREASMAFLLGASTTGVRSGAGRTWKFYKNGVLIRSGSRSWVVRSPLTQELDDRGGPAGSLGAPTGDARCGLPEGGCLQQFRTGAIYTNSKAKDTLTSAVSSTLGAADLLAVARSQVGYREPSPRKSKYNKWVGRTGRYDPWCGFFVSWLAHAGGKPGSIIKATSYKKLLDAERKRGWTSQTAKVGRLAYIGYFSKGTPSHVGIVTKVSSSHVWTIEGNVSAGGGQKHPRGVHVVKRTKSRIVFYADPRY